VTNYRGGCLCGSVRFVVNGPPVHTFYCHCRDCQKETGGPFATELFVKAALLEMSGEMREFKKTGDSGKTVTRLFCVSCGTTVVTVFESEPEHVCVKACALDDASELEPEFHLYVASKQPWYEITDGLPQYRCDGEW